MRRWKGLHSIRKLNRHLLSLPENVASETILRLPYLPRHRPLRLRLRRPIANQPTIGLSILRLKWPH